MEDQEKFTKEDWDHYSQQYERMQDMAKEYSIIAVKCIATVSGGSLIAIGAGYINFLSIDDINKNNSYTAVTNSFAQSFECFSYSLLISIFNFILIYLSRVCFLNATDVRYNSTIRKKNDKYGSIFECTAFIFFIISFAFFAKGLLNLSDTFQKFPY